MGKKLQKKKERPSVQQLREELGRVRYRRRFHFIARNTLFTLLVVAAVAVLIATLWLPVLQIYGGSMAPTLQDGDIVFSVKSSKLEPGDVVAFYYNNKILIKRVIGVQGDWIDIGQDGTVYVNGSEVHEPYLLEKSFGGADIELPYQVPDGHYFVMGDHRETSEDSRHKVVGCVGQEQIVGRIVFRIWPFKRISVVN